MAGVSRSGHSELSTAQIERTADRLAAAGPTQMRVVVVHQPLAVLRHEDRTNLLHGHALAAQR